MRVGILGAGNIAGKMCETLNKMPDNYVAAAVGSRDLKKAETFAKANGVEKAYGSYEELVADSSLDLIYIATPHSHHCEQAKLALNAGRNVLIEKAFTGNGRQARELVELANEKHLLLAEAIWTRYLPARGILNDIIKSGVIGKITHLTANLCYEINNERIEKPELAGGALLDLGVYVINFALMAFDADVDKVESRAGLTKSGVDAWDEIKITFADGKYAELFCSREKYSDKKGLIYGADGYIEFENVNCCEWIAVHGNDGAVTCHELPPQITGFEYQVLAAERAIAANRVEPAEMPHEEIIRVMDLMDLVREQVGVKYPFDN